MVFHPDLLSLLGMGQSEGQATTASQFQSCHEMRGLALEERKESEHHCLPASLAF